MKNSYPEIEFEPLKTAIEEKARLLLAEITEDNLKTFAQEVKLIYLQGLQPLFRRGKEDFRS